MKVEDFIREFRQTVHDHIVPPFWSDAAVVSYLNEAVQEACERAKLIEDRLTPDVCTIAIEPNLSTYPLHASVFEIKRVTLRGRPLDETSVEELDEDWCGWESMKGLPRWFIFEQASGARPASLRLVRLPTQSDTLTLTVYRGALRPLSESRPSDRPEMPERYHTRLLDWMYHRAYFKQDADTFDPAKGAQSLALFEQAFGVRPDANVQRKQADRQPPIVRCAW